MLNSAADRLGGCCPIFRLPLHMFFSIRYKDYLRHVKVRRNYFKPQKYRI